MWLKPKRFLFSFYGYRLWLLKEYSLRLDKFREDQKLIRETVKQLDSLLKLDTELKIAYLQEDIEKRASDTAKQERYNQWLKNLSKDIYLDQAVKVVQDMVYQQNMARKKDDEPVKAF